jgi:hypothetical protein
VPGPPKAGPRPYRVSSQHHRGPVLFTSFVNRGGKRRGSRLAAYVVWGKFTTEGLEVTLAPATEA